MNIDCFKCKIADGLKLGDGDPHCTGCRYTAPAEDVAEDFIEDVMGIDARALRKGAELPRHECPECDADAMVALGEDPDYFLCFACGSSWQEGELDRCAGDCNRYRELGESIICRDCFAAKVARSD